MVEGVMGQNLGVLGMFKGVRWLKPRGRNISRRAPETKPRGFKASGRMGMTMPWGVCPLRMKGSDEVPGGSEWRVQGAVTFLSP